MTMFSSAGSAATRSRASSSSARPLVERPEQHAHLHHRAGLVQPELELGDDPEVAAATAYRPEQVGVLVRRGAPNLAVGGDDLHRFEVVDAQPGLAGQPAHPAAEGEPTDAGVADHASRDREAVRLGRRVEVDEQRAATDAGAFAYRVDPDGVQPAQVDHQPVVNHAGAGCAAAHTDLQPGVLARQRTGLPRTLPGR